MPEFKDWDDQEYWEDDSKCVTCKADMGKSMSLFCSATCADIFAIRSQENDCYA